MYDLDNLPEEAVALLDDPSFERSLIFIPSWLEKRLVAFGKSERSIKSIDDLFSILIPSDVSFYMDQMYAIFQHPAVKPYAHSFKFFCPMDAETWGANISNAKAAKRYNELQAIMARARMANDPTIYSPIDSYVENDTTSGPAMVALNEATQCLDRKMLGSILGVNPENPDVDLLNLRVVLGTLDADTLTLKVGLIDNSQSKIPEVLAQTEANVKLITQYYEFNKITATPIGKYYCRLVLLSPNT